jgi:hypothetical protein
LLFFLIFLHSLIIHFRFHVDIKINIVFKFSRKKIKKKLYTRALEWQKIVLKSSEKFFVYFKLLMLEKRFFFIKKKTQIEVKKHKFDQKNYI